MFGKYKGSILAGLLGLLLTTPSHAQMAPGERAEGMARNWTNLAGFTGQCIDSKLLDKKYVKHAKFGAYLGGFVYGSLYEDQNKISQAVAAFAKEGGTGRVHEFNEGKLTAYDVEFNNENCATLVQPLEILFDQFSKAVLED